MALARQSTAAVSHRSPRVCADVSVKAYGVCSETVRACMDAKTRIRACSCMEAPKVN